MRFVIWNLLFCASVPLCLAEDVCAQETDGVKAITVQYVLDKMEEAERSIKDAGFSFEEQIHFSQTGETHVVRGKAVFKLPDKVRVELTEPREQTVISDGKNLWIHSGGSDQVFTDKSSNWFKAAGLPEVLVPFSISTKMFRRKFSFVFGDMPSPGAQADKDFLLILKPKRKPKDFEENYSIRVKVSGENFLVDRMELKTDNAEIAVLVSGYKINQGVDPGLFRSGVPGAQ